VLVIASTTTNWIGGGAAAVGALGAIAVVILGVIVARRQGRIEASQLAISEHLQAIETQRFTQERTPLVVVETAARCRKESNPKGIVDSGYQVTLTNAGRGAAIGIHVLVTVHRDTTSQQPAGYIDCDLLMPGASRAFPISAASQELDGTATVSGFCADVDGNRHEITPPPPMKPTPNPVTA
jgi:hypothetical protein